MVILILWFLENQNLHDLKFEINFENLFTNVSIVKRKLKKALGRRLKIREYVDNKISQYSNKTYEKKEFKPGFFKYLDNLHLNLKAGYLPNNVYYQCRSYTQILTQHTKDIEKYIVKKYGIDVSFLRQ